MGIVPSLSILVPKLLPPYHSVATVPLPDGLVCSKIVSLHDLEWLLVLHHKRNQIALVYLVHARSVIHHNGISEALRHGTHYVVWPTPKGGPNNMRLV